MSLNKKEIYLLVLTGLIVLGTFLFPPISQTQSYHHFADTRRIWGLSNFLNVVSNFPFLIVGVIGLYDVATTPVRRGIRGTYLLLFLGVLLTGFGSAYYHWQPNNDTLVWDRIPLTIVFMSLLSATISRVLNYKIGVYLLVPLVMVGVGSVWWWHYTESHGIGDLRLYILVQYYPVLFIPLLLWLFYKPELKKAVHILAWVVIWYLIAKFFEQFDQQLYQIMSVSGHTLKHLAAAVSTWYFVPLFGEMSHRLAQSTKV